MARRTIRLSKDDIEVGSILWLRKDAMTVDPAGFTKSKLVRDALGHPCIIVDLQQDRADTALCNSILICKVSYIPGRL